MRIIDLQRRLREIGRIRLGEKVETKNRKGETVYRPAKIETLRFTSRDQKVIEAAAEKWGGTVEPWDDAPDGKQWQVTTTTTEISVVVPPGDMSFSQSYEIWTRGGCKVRCDGRWDHIGDKACHCDPENRACDIHSRLSVILPDLPGLGVWRLDTKGYYAAVELGGVVDICAAQSERGVMLPARLRLEQRSVKRNRDGHTETYRFAVPVLDLDVHPLSLTAGAKVALPSPNLTPVPPPDAALMPSVAEQIAAVDEPVKRVERANSAEPIPSTGLRPRTAVEAATSPDSAADRSQLEALADTTAKQSKALKAAVVAARHADLTLPGSFDDITRPELVAAAVSALGGDS